jgi:hypothetical protein
MAQREEWIASSQVLLARTSAIACRTSIHRYGGHGVVRFSHPEDSNFKQRRRIARSKLSSPGLTGRSSTPRLLDSITAASGILGRPVKPGDDEGECGAQYSSNTSPRSRGACARVVREFFAQVEGAGNAGRPMRPQSRVRNRKAHERSHHGHTGCTRHSLRKGEFGHKNRLYQ